MLQGGTLVNFADYMVLAMRERARQKGNTLFSILYLNTAILCALLFMMRLVEQATNIDVSYIKITIFIYYISTFIFYLYEIVCNFRSYFYAYAQVVRKRSLFGPSLWFFVVGCVCLLFLLATLIMIAAFDEKFKSYITDGSIRWLITLNIAAGADIIFFGIYACCVLGAYRNMRRSVFSRYP